MRSSSAATPPDEREPRIAAKAGLARGARIFLAACIITSLLSCVGLLVYGSERGLDLTDEIFYLVWAGDPKAYALIYQPFGYLLHPLYRFLGGNIAAYRLAGFAIAGGAGAFVGHSLGRATRNGSLFTFYGAAAAMTNFFPWIITPSYNSAANIGGLLLTGGVLNILTGPPRQRLAGTLAIAAGLCIAVFSKPPLWALSVAGIILAAIALRSARLFLLASLGLGVAATFLFIAPAEIPELVHRIIVTQHLLALPNTPLGLPGKVLRDWLAVPLPLTAAALGAVSSFGLGRTRWYRWPGYAAILLGFYYVGTIVPDAIEGSIPDFLGLAIMAIAAGYTGVVQHALHANRLSLALLFAVPVGVALGTFNNQWFQLNFSMAFPFLALFTLALSDPVTWRRIAAEAAAIVGPVLVMLLAAWAPYSLPASIFDQQVAIEPPLAHGKLLVDEETATFVRSARGIARGALVIDLSGTGPGVGAVLGAHVPVLPWLNPATPTWPDLVWARLTVRERDSAWFVVPVWPTFGQSHPALWLRAHQGRFCRISLPPMTFWGEERSLEIWRPCEEPASSNPPRERDGTADPR
ncbi:MAG TPA: hypothetical protein VGU01_11745 [Sphingomicrobium sp.]|nr:hypothetical protein [Sphingomicrobium sp.]